MNSVQKVSSPSVRTVPPANPFSGLPDLMKSILYHEENTQTNIQIEKSHDLTQAQGDAMMHVIREIILKTVPPNQLVQTIKDELHIDVDQATSLARDLLGRRFLPMEWYIGPVQPLIQELGGDVSQYLAEAKKIYPEVYSPQAVAESGEAAPAAVPEDFHLVENFDDWIQTPKGKAEILLRLTNLSIQIDEAIKSQALSELDGQSLLRDLDAVSYAINTQDLNQFEIHSMRRQVEKILTAVKKFA